MRRSPAIIIGCLIAVAAATVWCFSIVMGRRFAGGEVYPPCSSQRPDPMGAKALYEAIDRLGSVTCERNSRALNKLQGSRGKTLVVLDVHPFSYTAAEDLQVGPFEMVHGIDGDAVWDFAAGGGRVVITLQGQTGSSKVWDAAKGRQRELEARRRLEKETGKKQDEGTGKDRENNSKPGGPPKKSSKESPEKSGKKGLDPDDDGGLPFKPAKSLREILQVAVKEGELPKVPKEGYVLDTPEGIAVLEGRLPAWFSNAILDLAPKPEAEETKEDPSKAQSKPPTPARETWKVLATAHGNPVLAERRVGAGTIVLATDTYFATNQALMAHPAPEFLAWLIGDARQVIFDETHLGTQENPGIMAMALRYRLHGFFLGGVLLFLLFVWQGSSSLVPSNDGMEAGPRMVAGQGAVAALVSLLRRGVPRSRLLQTCFDQWLHNHPHPGAALRGRIEQARALLPQEVKRPARGALVRLYQRLCETLHPNRH